MEKWGRDQRARSAYSLSCQLHFRESALRPTPILAKLWAARGTPEKDTDSAASSSRARRLRRLDLSAVAVISGLLSTTLAFASSTGFASAIFSTSGFGVSAFGAVLMPCVICEKSVAEMMSTGRGIRRRARSAAWRRTRQAPTPAPPRARSPIWSTRPSSLRSPARPPSPARRGGSRPPTAVPSRASPCRNRPSCRHAHRCARQCRRAPG